jgi:hypothetical protein
MALIGVAAALPSARPTLRSIVCDQLCPTPAQTPSCADDLRPEFLGRPEYLIQEDLDEVEPKLREWFPDVHPAAIARVAAMNRLMRRLMASFAPADGSSVDQYSYELIRTAVHAQMCRIGDLMPHDETCAGIFEEFRAYAAYKDMLDMDFAGTSMDSTRGSFKAGAGLSDSEIAKLFEAFEKTHEVFEKNQREYEEYEKARNTRKTV